MNTQKFRKGLVSITASAMFALATTQSAFAGPGTLPDAPLFLSTAVEPNVFFTLDDSGSMDNVFIFKKTAGISSDGGQPLNDSGGYIGYWHPTWTQLFNEDAVPPSNGTQTSWDKYWILRNHHGNKLYYNPDITYEPWVGLDASGNALYEEHDPTNVPQDPNYGTRRADLTTAFDFGGYSKALYLPTYFIWNDDGNGIMEQSDGRTMVEIKPGSNYTSPGGIVRTYKDEMQNFANWFVYYRSRNNATKAAIGAIINNNNTTRMGLEYFNNTISRFGVKSMSSDANKLDILQTFYSLVIEGKSTPARRALGSVGEYFKDTSNGPILPKADGGECQQNFNILMTDGFWKSGHPSGIYDEDSDGNTDFDGSKATADGRNTKDGVSRTLADVAMYYYENDLITSYDDKVPTKEGVDLAEHQHLVTYTVAFGLEGTLDTSIDPADTAKFKGWPNAFNGDDEKIDDLFHAAYNARGKFFSANNSEELKTSLGTAISDIDAQTATAAAVSINSAKLTTESTVFLAEFNSGGWSGDLKAVRIEDPATGALETEKDPITGATLLDANGEPVLKTQWRAGEALDSLNAGSDKSAASAARKILTYDGTDGIPFQWGTITTAQIDDLNTDPTGATDALGEKRLNYIRGSQVDEGAGEFFRERTSLLGDLVSSAPVFVGEPNLRWPDTAPFPDTAPNRYSDFKNSTAKNRDGVVYVGSNDGMIHGFVDKDAGSGGGEEVLAYIPSNLFSTQVGEGLHYLTDPSYGHKFYNDLTPSLSDVYIKSDWKTVLIAGQRSGGRGISALDVTNPSTFSEANAGSIVLWEFNQGDDADLGFTFSKPQIGMMNSGKWVAIFGNGYNDTGDGKAKLFILDIEQGVDNTWTLGSNYLVISTGVGSTTNRNGLATPALADLDGNGTIDRAYAGDLEGNMWAFDLSGNTTASWGIAYGGNASGGSPLFSTGGLPITAKPTLATHPTLTRTTGNAPNIMVFFGSGQYLVDADLSTTNDNYFYGVWDRDDANRTTAHLVQQSYDTSFTQRVLTTNSVNYSGGEYGWYFKLADSSAENAGERSVTEPVVRGNEIFFNSFVPGSDPCLVGGFGFRFAVDIVNGGSPAGAVVDSNDDGIVNDADLASNGGSTAAIAAIRQDGFLPQPVFIEDIAFTADTPTKVKKLKDLPTGRFSWQELLQ